MTDHSFFLKGSNNKGILLVHGLTGAPAEMKFVGKYLNKIGFTVYAPVIAGHCRDEKALLSTNYMDWLRGLQTAIQSLKEYVDDISVVGICVGGGLSLYLSKLEPSLVNRVIVYAPALRYDGWNQSKWYRFAPIFRNILIRIPSFKKMQFDERYPYGIKSDRVRKAIMREGQGMDGMLPYFPARSLYQNYCFNNILQNDLSYITVPTLLIHAIDDDVSHPRNSYKIQRLHGGSCDIALLKDSYHMIHIDQERHKVAQLTADFCLRDTFDSRKQVYYA